MNLFCSLLGLHYLCKYEERDIVWFVAPRHNIAGWQQDILANGQDTDDHRE